MQEAVEKREEARGLWGSCCSKSFYSPAWRDRKGAIPLPLAAATSSDSPLTSAELPAGGPGVLLPPQCHKLISPCFLATSRKSSLPSLSIGPQAEVPSLLPAVGAQVGTDTESPHEAVTCNGSIPNLALANRSLCIYFSLQK